MSFGQRLRFLARDTATYGLGGALNRLTTLITFPLLARHFSVEEYGTIDLLNTSVVLLVTLLVFGQDSGVARFFYEDTATSSRRQVVSQSLALQAAILAATLPVLWLNAKPIAAWMSTGPDGENVVKLMILQAPFFLLINFSQNLLKWTFKRWHFLLISVGSSVVTMLGLVIGITLPGFGIVEVFAVYLVTRAIFGLIGLWFIRDWLARPSGFECLKQMMPFAIPFGVICVIGAVLPVLERGMVQSLLGPQELGLYAAGAKVAMLIALPINAFEIALGAVLLVHFQGKRCGCKLPLRAPVVCRCDIYDGPGSNRAGRAGLRVLGWRVTKAGPSWYLLWPWGLPFKLWGHHLEPGHRLFEEILSEALWLLRNLSCRRRHRHSPFGCGLGRRGRSLGQHGWVLLLPPMWRSWDGPNGLIPLPGAFRPRYTRRYNTGSRGASSGDVRPLRSRRRKPRAGARDSSPACCRMASFIR